MTPQEAFRIHNASQHRLPMWTITERPRDYPEGYVARMHYSLPRPAVTPYALHAQSLAEVRRLLPPGLYRLGRSPQDDPVIVETWL